MKPLNRMAALFSWTRDGITSEMPTPPAYRVGELFRQDKTAWPEGAQYTYGLNGHELTIFAHEPDTDLTADVAKGEAEFALGIIGPILYFAFRLGRLRKWLDVPYSWHVHHEGVRSTPPQECSQETRALLWISLVDTRNGLVLAQRGLTLNPEFTRTLNRAIRDQAASNFDPLEVALTLAEASQGRPDAIHRLDFARAWSDGNA